MGEPALAIAAEAESPAGANGAVSPLKRRVVSSLAWSLTGFGTQQVLRFAFNLILTRLLLPDAFGLMALIDLFILGLYMFSDVGLGLSIVRSHRGDDPHYLNVAWSVQIVRGLVLWLAAWRAGLAVGSSLPDPGAYLVPVGRGLDRSHQRLQFGQYLHQRTAHDPGAGGAPSTRGLLDKR